MSDNRQPKKILIVDDEPAVVSYLEMLLHDSGYETVSAPDGLTGLEAFRRDKPDLVTLDISMPEASGTRFYREVRSDPESRAVPIIIITAVTGYAGDKYGYEKFLNQIKLVPPPDGFFPKPIDRDEVIAKVDELLS